MKYFIFLLLLVVSCGTEQGKGKVYNYKVINESGVSIEIRSYRSSFPNKAPVITIINTGDTLEKRFQDFLPPSGYAFREFFGSNGLEDSLNVIYNQDKIAIFTEDGSRENLRNPLNRFEYRGLNETFVFTEQDYIDAEDCNGNCD